MKDVPDFLQAAPCPALQAAHRYSQLQLQQLKHRFESCAADLSAIETIAIGGSLGRLEASADSDVDCIIVLRDEISVAEGEAQVGVIHELLAHSPFKAPKPDGIYRRGIVRKALLEHAALGSLNESAETFGKRMQLLLDARPLFGGQRFHALQRAIIGWYGSDFLTTSPSRSWTYLSHDLMRYLHSYAAWQQFKFKRSADDSWQLRQAKFRTSRLLTFAALMFLLGESDRDANKMDWLHQRLALTPLQRLHSIMRIYEPKAYCELLSAYETSFAILADSAVRASLVASGPDTTTRMSATFHPAYEGIRQSSTPIARVLTEFALARRVDWGGRFFERWLF